METFIIFVTELIVPILTFIGLVILGLFFGRLNEKNHLKSLDQREEQTRDFLITDIRRYESPDPSTNSQIVVAEVVIATDYLKTFLASIKKLLGGEVRSYLTLLDRARREAILRIVEQAIDNNCNAICNIRIETADITGESKRKGAIAVGIVASGTAYRCTNR